MDFDDISSISAARDVSPPRWSFKGREPVSKKRREGLIHRVARSVADWSTGRTRSTETGEEVRGPRRSTISCNRFSGNCLHYDQLSTEMKRAPLGRGSCSDRDGVSRSEDPGRWTREFDHRDPQSYSRIERDGQIEKWSNR